MNEIVKMWNDEVSDLKERIKSIEKELEDERNKRTQYYSALYSIRCAVEILRRGRIADIRKTLDENDIPMPRSWNETITNTG